MGGVRLLSAVFALVGLGIAGVVALRRRALRLEAERWLRHQSVPSSPERPTVWRVESPFYDQAEQWPERDEGAEPESPAPSSAPLR